MTITNAAAIRQIVSDDATASGNNWDAAIEESPEWTLKAAQCRRAYDAALEAIDAGDLETAEACLERASALESAGGDNGDAQHALVAVRSFLGAAVEP